METTLITLAPMEGITTHIYRNALNKYYGGVDLFYSPFISAHRNKSLNAKEVRDILPENNREITLIPQVLCNSYEDFSNTANQIRSYGYQHINLNFGCPSGTVTAKGKGAGILNDPKCLKVFLDELFSKTDFEISIKTRIGFSSPLEWEDLLKVYKEFPLKELIVHTRIREDFYKNPVQRESMREAFDILENQYPISYNGDITSYDDVKSLYDTFPEVHSVMIGRGLISKPFLGSDIKKETDSASFDDKTFYAFHVELLNNYQEILSGDRNVLFKLKELWPYMSTLFKDSDKLTKRFLKCNSIKEYESILRSLCTF